MRKKSRIDWLFLVLFLSVLVAGPARAGEFSRELVSGRFTFQVTSANLGTTNRVRVTPSGPGIDPHPVDATARGTVTWAEVTDDLDNDGFPELYVYAACPGDASMETGFENPADPSLVAVVTPRGHGGQMVPVVPVLTPGAHPGASAVVVGPGVTRHADNGTVRVLPVVPVEKEQASTICGNELKFILVPGARDGSCVRRKDGSRVLPASEGLTCLAAFGRVPLFQVSRKA